MRFFKEEKQVKVASLGYTVTQYSHETGATLVHIHADTPERAFCAAFKTVPWDDTGVFHILEHSCFSGSESYPIGSPILYMMKNSMQTYLNAITFQGKTMYPCASCNSKDFENLMQVYLDAVFHPLLTRETFFREGWHLENGDLQGVVYNEMHGALSGLDARIYQTVKQDLYPHTYQRFCSGGEPGEIPMLTYEAFLQAHRQHYCAGNCVLCLRGDFEPEEYDFLLHRALLAAPQGGAAREYDCQTENRGVFHHTYPVTEDAQTAARTALVFSYNVGDFGDSKRLFAMSLLAQYLMDGHTAPLMKALLETGLLQDARYIFSQEMQNAFGIAIYQTERAHLETIADTIGRTVARIIAQGVDKTVLRASLTAMDFQTRENALQVRGRALEDFAKICSNLFCGLPIDWDMDTDALIQELDKALDTDFYENLLREVILENPVTVCSILEPQPQKAAAVRRQQAEALAARLTPEELEKVTIRLQPKPDRPEDLAKMPQLGLQDMQMKLYQREFSAHGPVLHTPVETAGIVYLRYYFSMAGLSEQECLTAKLLSSAFAQLSTEKTPADQLRKRIRANVGQMNFYPTAVAPGPETAQPYFMVTVSCLEKYLPQVMQLLQEILTQTCFGEKELEYVLASEGDSLHRAFVNNGMSIAQNRSGAGQFLGIRYLDLFGGLEYLRYVDQCRQAPADFAAAAEEMAKKLFCRGNLAYVGVTCGSVPEQFAPELPEGAMLSGCPIALAEGNDAYAVGSGVNYNAASVRWDDLQPFSGKHLVLAKLLSLGYLWQQIREQGGAYGAFAQFTRNGRLLLSAYRDPHVARTAEVFREIADYLESAPWTEEEITGAIISVVAELTNPKTPAADGIDRELAYLTDYSPEDRQRVLQQVCDFRREDVAQFVPIFRRLARQMNRCSVGSREKQENSQLFDRVITVS